MPDMKSKNLEKYGMFYILIAIFILLLALNYLNPVLLWDETVYLSNARSHISQANFQEDFRFPLLECIIATAWSFSGESIFIARLIIILFSLGLIFIFYQIARIHFNKKHALIATALFSLSSQLLFWGFRAYADIPALFFISLAYWLIAHSGKYHTTFVLFAGLVSGLAFLTRFPMALFALAAGICFIFKKQYRDFILYSMGFAVALLPWFVYNYVVYLDFLWDFRMYRNVVSAYVHSKPAFIQIKNLFLALGVLCVFLPFGAYCLIKKKKGFLILTYLAIFCIYYLFIAKPKLGRYWVSGLTFLYIVCYWGILYCYGFIKSNLAKKLIWLIIVLSVSISLVTTTGGIAFSGECVKNGALIKSVDYVQDKIHKEDIIISNFWPWFGYYNNVKVMSIWTEDVSKLLPRKPKYIIHGDEKMPVSPFNKTVLDEDKRLSLETIFCGKCGECASIYRVKY